MSATWSRRLARWMAAARPARRPLTRRPTLLTLEDRLAPAGFMGGVRVAVADVTGDGKADVITAAGSTGGPHVKVFANGTFAEVGGWYAYSPDYSGGVFVAAGDTDGDGRAEVITGAGQGGEAHVVVYKLQGATRL